MPSTSACAVPMDTKPATSLPDVAVLPLGVDVHVAQSMKGRSMSSSVVAGQPWVEVARKAFSQPTVAGVSAVVACVWTEFFRSAPDSLIKVLVILIGAMVLDTVGGTFRACKEGKWSLRGAFKAIRKPCTYVGILLVGALAGSMMEVSSGVVFILATGLAIIDLGSAINHYDALTDYHLRAGPIIHVLNLLDSLRQSSERQKTLWSPVDREAGQKSAE